MNCLCCGKPLFPETENGWHKACIKRFFGSASIPQIEIDENTLMALATDCVQKGLTVPGVQKKISLHLCSDGRKSRLTLVDYPTGYILKPQVKEYGQLPESEQLVMCMAEATGISTVPHALINDGEKMAYITKRIDRIIDKAEVTKLAMEDFCQLTMRITADKYKGSYERCAQVLQRYSSRVGYDMTEFFMRLVFSFAVGNSDMHLKNFSLIETASGSRNYVLSAAYDLLPVNVIMPADKEEMALTLNGKKMHLRRNDFLLFADKCGISRVSAEKMIEKIVSMKETYIAMCQASLLNEKLKQRFVNLIGERCEALKGFVVNT